MPTDRSAADTSRSVRSRDFRRTDIAAYGSLDIVDSTGPTAPISRGHPRDAGVVRHALHEGASPEAIVWRFPAGLTSAGLAL